MTHQELWILEADKQINNKKCLSWPNLQSVNHSLAAKELKIQDQAAINCVPLAAILSRAILSPSTTFLTVLSCMFDFMPLGQNESAAHQVTVDLE